MMDLELIHISNQEELEYLLHRFQNGPTFAEAFVFDTEDLLRGFLSAINADDDLYCDSGSFFDIEKSIHISRSEEGYVWISNMGLVAGKRITKNKFLNACSGQMAVLLHLLEDAIELCRDERTYWVNSYKYSQVEMLTPIILHNTLFYFELLTKAYLDLNGQSVPRTHRLGPLLDSVKATMVNKNHNNTIFHAIVVPMIERTVKHISALPGNFREEYVKYDDNPEDTTCILFNEIALKELCDVVKLSEDMITEMYYAPNDNTYLKPGLYERLCQMSDTDEKKRCVMDTFRFLIGSSDTSEQEKACHENNNIG